VDLGADSVFVYRLDPENGALLPQEDLTVKLQPGSGPRHMAFHPNGFAYVLTEISWQIAAFRYTPKPFGFELMQVVPTLPDDFHDTNYSAAIRISPDGGTLYASNRGHDSISVFRIDPSTGMLEFVQRAPSLGGWPRDFAFDPTGRFLLAANQNSDTIVTFEIEPGTGRLMPNGQIAHAPKPVCIQFMELD
jgi:6-phosphogluconolactonase